MIFATKEHIPTLLKLARKTTLKMIVCIDALSEDSAKILKAWGEVQDVKVVQFSERAYSLSFFPPPRYPNPFAL